MDVTQVIHPQDNADTATKLGRIVDRLEAEITSQQAQDRAGTNRYEARLADAHWMLDRLAERADSAVRYGCYATVHHPDKQQCRDTLD